MFVGLHVDADDFLADFGGKFEPLFGNAAPAIDGDNGDGRLGVPGLHRHDARRAHANGVIVPPHEAKEHDQQRNKKERDPGALREFCARRKR